MVKRRIPSKGKDPRWPKIYWTVGICSLIVAMTGVTLAVLLSRQAKSKVSNFEQCKESGGVIMEIYPEQCRIDGQTFVNTAQTLQSANDYIGLSEGEALDKARRENIPARVVERDGEGLPVTLDFTFGRHNFYVRENVVYQIEVEGQSHKH